jgi:hypothetical protein
MVNNQFEKWLNGKHGKHGKVTMTSGKVQGYILQDGIRLYCKQGELKIGMTKYVKSMLDNFPA